MRDHYEQVYYQTPNSYQAPEQHLVKKSSGNVLGRFLKLGKSKSDAQGYGLKNRSSSYHDDLEEDFRLSPSIRGPVEKMVHKANSRKDVSRSHSWIYGSVKLPSDLPFGYGYQNGFGSNGNSPNSGGGSGSNSSASQGHNPVQIPRCQVVDYCCSCDCSGDFDFLTPGPGSPQSNSPCQACALEAGKYGKNRKQQSHQREQESGKNFVSSVRKLTWKSLKQVVKKRPSLDSIKKPNGMSAAPSIPTLPSSIEIMPSPGGPYLSSHAADDMQPNYFFPEKKNFYASCNDLYGEPGPHVTASVRVRPKRSRQPWHFPNEFGPVPNYQEEDLYHSEWDLRQYMPYDMWLTTTNNVKPRSNMKPTSPTPDSTPHSNNSTSVYTSKSPAKTFSSGMTNAKSNNRVPPPSSSSSSGDTVIINHQSNNTGSTNSNNNPSSSSTNNKGSVSAKTNLGIVKRSSILHTDVTAYQLLKAQTKKKAPATPEGVPRLDDELSESSDDLSDNVLTDDPVRIGGQGIYMVSSVSIGSSGSSVNNGASRGFAQILGKSANSKGSSKQAIPDGVWSDQQIITIKGSQSKHASSNRDRDQHLSDKVNNRLIDLHDQDTTTKMNHTSNSFTPQTQSASTAMPKPPPLPPHGMENGNFNLHAGPSSSSNNITNVTANGIHNNSGITNNVRMDGGSSSDLNGSLLSNSNNHSASTTSSSSSSFSNDSNNNFNNNHNHISVANKSSYSSNDIINHGSEQESQDDGFEFEEFVYDEHAMSCNETNANHNPPSISSFNNMISATENRNRSANRNPLAQPSMREHSFELNSHRNPMSAKHSTPVNNANGNSHANTSSSSVVSFADSSSNSSSSNNNANKSHSNENGSNRSTSASNGAKYGALRRRKGRNGPGGKTLLRETIYEEEDYDDHNNMEDSQENNEKAQSHHGKDYSVKIVVSQSGSSSSSSSAATEYVKPILKNRDRVYETPNVQFNGNGQMSKGSSPNGSEIYFDSSVSTASKKKVQFDSSKIIVCGGDSGSDYYDDDDDSNEESGNGSRSSGMNGFKSNDEQPVDDYEDEDDDDDADTLCDEDIHNDSPIEKTSRVVNSVCNNNESRNGSSIANNVKPARNDAPAFRSESEEQKMAQRGKTSFEEEVARKAAAIAAALARKKQAEEEQEELYDEVNNLQPQIQQHQHLHQSKSINATTSNSSNDDGRNSSKLSKQCSDIIDDSIKRNNNIKSNLKKTIPSRSSIGCTPAGRDSQMAPTHNLDPSAMGKNEKTEMKLKNSSKTPHGPSSLKAERIANASDKSAVKGCGPQKIINPNSLLFNDTTRIRLNQSRPSMNDTFKLNLSQNGQGGSGNVLNNGGSRLANKLNRIKQSNSFRTSTSAPLRPKEPPPPPPIVRSLSEEGKTSSNTKSVNQKNQKGEQIYQKSHYGPGGMKLPTKSQISLPFGLTTTSNQNSSPSTQLKSQNANNESKNSSTAAVEHKIPLGSRNSGPITTGKNIRVGQNRSKSLTDRCEALEKVLSQRNSTNSSTTNINNNNVNKSPPTSKANAGGVVNGLSGGNSQNKSNNNPHQTQLKKIIKSPSNLIKSDNSYVESQSHSSTRNENEASRHLNNKMTDNTFHSSPHQEEPQNIEIVTKENSVSEIRIYSGTTNINSNSSNCNKVIVYDSTTMAANVNKNSSTQEIHYAATDLFPHPSSQLPHNISHSSSTSNNTNTTSCNVNSNKHIRQSSAPSLPSSRPHSTSVVLIIDTGASAESTDSIITTSTKTTAPTPSTPLTYCQPVDLLPPAPQLPLPPPPPPPVPSHQKMSHQPIQRVNTNTRVHTNPPQLPPPPVAPLMPISKKEDIRMSVENDSDSEPLYDDVLTMNSLALPAPPLQKPSSVPTSVYNNKSSHQQGNSIALTKEIAKSFGDVLKKSQYGPSTGRTSVFNSKTHSQINLPPPPPLPTHVAPPPPPPTPSHANSGNVLSSTLPCLACPPSLPPPNLPSKNLSEFQHRPLVINHEEDEDDEVDDLYNHISEESHTKSVPCFTKGPGSTSSSSSKSTLKNYEYDRRSGFSAVSRSICSSGRRDSQQSDENEGNIIYDDTLSIITTNYEETKNNKITASSCPSRLSSSAKPIINHGKGGSSSYNGSNINSNSNNNKPPSHILSMSSSVNNNNVKNALLDNIDEVETCLDSDADEPLYDDVLNLTENNNDNNKRKSVAESCGDSGADCEAEDSPPPLPAQGPPLHLLPKVSTDLPLLSFPLLVGTKIGDTPKYGANNNPVPSNTSTSSVLQVLATNNNVRTMSQESFRKDVDGGNDSQQDKLKMNKGSVQDLQLSRCKFNSVDNGTSNGADAINQPGRTQDGQLNHQYTHSSSVSSLVHSSSNKHINNHNTPFTKSHNLPSFQEETESELGNSHGQQNDNGIMCTSSDNAIINSNNSNEDDVLDRTRTLLNELNEKLSKLNFCTPDYSTYISKVVISSSSESSGVEEDYNSEKNYSLSNGSDVASSSDENYKLSAVSKLVSETISMARGKFLDSMKLSMLSGGGGSPMINLGPVPVGSSGGNSVSPVSNGGSPDNDEPIYEEIGDMNRSTSPIYADAFDAKSIFDGASRNEILSFLESIRDRLTVTESNSSDSQSSSLCSKKGRKFIEIERNDSGIGSESGSLVAVANSMSNGSNNSTLINDNLNKSVHRLCPDCNDAHVDKPKLLTASSSEEEIHEKVSRGTGPNLCNSCDRKRNERKEIIMEIYETELKYGRDLKIIAEEFYNPIQIAGLLTKEQLDQIFLNVEELIEINMQLTIMMKAAIESVSGEKHDEDLTAVNVGKIFIDFGERMMCAFENYCTRQASAGALLTQLEKEKELLRIFLRVSQMENTVLRRMNLPAFLMVPVQRVTRYPLLLSRLLKVTPVDHFSREELQSAQEKIEQHLEHMNKTTREVASVKLWRRISIINSNNSPIHRRSSSDLDGANVRIRKMALDVLDWANFTDVTCVIENQLNIVHFNGKPLRNIYGCLLARGKDLESLALKMDQDIFFPPAEDVVKDVKLVLVRAKNTRFCLLREPLCLSKCVVSQGENEFLEFIEINEITTKNTYYIQGMDKHGTSMWLRLLQCHAVCVGQWRRRRGALANIMMNGMIRHL